MATIVKMRRLRSRQPGLPDASSLKKGVSLKRELRGAVRSSAFFQVPLLSRPVALSFYSDPQVRIGCRAR